MLKKDFDKYEIIVPLGDIHLGYGTVNMVKVQKVIEFIKENNAKWIGMGDLIDNTPPIHRYFDMKNVTMTPQEQVINIVNLLKPIKDNCLGLLYGNHEIRSIEYKTGYDPIIQMEEMLGLEKRGLGSQTFFNINAGVCKYSVFATHGSTRGIFFSTRKGYKINKLLSLHNLAIADLYLMGHLHDTEWTTANYLVGEKKISTSYFVMTGAFVEYFGSYGERYGYNPVETGCNVIFLGKKRKRIIVERLV